MGICRNKSCSPSNPISVHVLINAGQSSRLVFKSPILAKPVFLSPNKRTHRYQSIAMQCKAGGFAHSCYEKRWNPHFTARRVFKGNTNKPIIEHKRKELGEKRSDLEVFFLESVSPGSLWKLKEIKRLFRAMDPDNLMQAKGIVGCRKAAWVVDEGSFAQGITGGDLGNECKDKLSANELLQRLKMPVIMERSWKRKKGETANPITC